MLFAPIDNKLTHVDKQIENLRLDMQAAIHNEFMYLVNKMLLLAPFSKKVHIKCKNIFTSKNIQKYGIP
jgi:hypothetical protein